MERQPVSSSQMDSVGYDPSTKTLEIEFPTGAIYQYFGVPPEVHEGLIAASSVGRYFGEAIRNNYEYQRL